ncbi:MAG: MotA/TolQ/ExbB proton channel family protein [Alphaproteobacteria bacterium]|nr:MotA/TolQ/ExbB proton channel family protein [Alphaproteobacteria bacterium]
MDLATIIGIAAGSAVVIVAIALGGSFMSFVDMPSVLIVIGGGFAATLIRFPLAGVASAFQVGGKVAFTHVKVEPRELIEKIAEMGDVVRRSGPLGLEGIEVTDSNLRKGAQMIADGYDATFIRESMELARDQFLTRLTEGQRVFKSLGDAAPAFGMIGTLVGLVQMLGNMDDPSSIGPSMAVALLTTLYGAVIANLVCLPISDKLIAKIGFEEINQTLIIDGIMSVREGKSPNLIREMLVAYLPEHQRNDPDDKAA